MQFSDNDTLRYTSMFLGHYTVKQTTSLPCPQEPVSPVADWNVSVGENLGVMCMMLWQDPYVTRTLPCLIGSPLGVMCMILWQDPYVTRTQV